MTSAEMIRLALVHGVRKVWTEAGKGVDYKLADLAVDEVISALRANPAWSDSLLGKGRLTMAIERIVCPECGAPATSKMRAVTGPIFLDWWECDCANGHRWAIPNDDPPTPWREERTEDEPQ